MRLTLKSWVQLISVRFVIRLPCCKDIVLLPCPAVALDRSLLPYTPVHRDTRVSTRLEPQAWFFLVPFYSSIGMSKRNTRRNTCRASAELSVTDGGEDERELLLDDADVPWIGRKRLPPLLGGREVWVDIVDACDGRPFDGD